MWLALSSLHAQKPGSTLVFLTFSPRDREDNMYRSKYQACKQNANHLRRWGDHAHAELNWSHQMRREGAENVRRCPRLSLLASTDGCHGGVQLHVFFLDLPWNLRFYLKCQFVVITNWNFVFLDCDPRISDQLYLMVMYISFYGF
jgi:hypothetical protein